MRILSEVGPGPTLALPPVQPQFCPLLDPVSGSIKIGCHKVFLKQIQTTCGGALDRIQIHFLHIMWLKMWTRPSVWLDIGGPNDWRQQNGDRVKHATIAITAMWQFGSVSPAAVLFWCDGGELWLETFSLLLLLDFRGTTRVASDDAYIVTITNQRRQVLEAIWTWLPEIGLWRWFMDPPTGERRGAGSAGDQVLSSGFYLYFIKEYKCLCTVRCLRTH